MMTIWYDGTDIDDLADLHKKGIVSGVTTNLSFVNKARLAKGVSQLEVLEPIADFCRAEKLPLSIQLKSDEVSDMKQEGLHLQEHYSRIEDFFVKVPVSFEKLEVINYLTNAGVRVNATCVTSTLQGIFAMNAGAEIISFFWGKMTDQGIAPADHVACFKSYRDKHRPRSRILVGSFRQTVMIAEALSAGADVCTVPLELLRKCPTQLQSEEANTLFQETNF